MIANYLYLFVVTTISILPAIQLLCMLIAVTLVVWGIVFNFIRSGWKEFCK